MKGRLKTLWVRMRSTLSGGSGPAMITCEEALEHLFEYLDGELDDEMWRRVDEHLEVCKACYPRASFERSFLEAVERAREVDPVPESVRARVLEAVRAAASDGDDPFTS